MFSILMVLSGQGKHWYWVIMPILTEKRPTNDPLTPSKISGHPVSWMLRKSGFRASHKCEACSRDTHMLASSPPPLSHCPDLLPSSAKKNTQKTQFSPHSPIFRINPSDPSRPHFEDERKSHVTVCSHCCGSSEITPLVQHSRMKLPFERSIEFKFYFHYQCYFRIIATIPKTVLH